MQLGKGEGEVTWFPAILSDFKATNKLVLKSTNRGMKRHFFITFTFAFIPPLTYQAVLLALYVSYEEQVFFPDVVCVTLCLRVKVEIQGGIKETCLVSAFLNFDRSCRHVD